METQARLQRLQAKYNNKLVAKGNNSLFQSVLNQSPHDESFVRSA